VDPIFDRKGQTVGWLQGSDLLNLSGVYQAFVENSGAVFSFADGSSLGTYEWGVFRDPAGDAVAFTRGASTPLMLPVPAMPPIPPIPEIRQFPPMPASPPAPVEPGPGWSRLTFDQVFGNQR
jgi:hypothetical protein